MSSGPRGSIFHVSHTEKVQMRPKQSSLVTLLADSATIQCDQCEKMFYMASELKSHKLFKHSSDRNEACDRCHRTFKTKGLLRRHQNTYHSTERKHMCDGKLLIRRDTSNFKRQMWKIFMALLKSVNFTA